MRGPTARLGLPIPVPRSNPTTRSLPTARDVRDPEWTHAAATAGKASAPSSSDTTEPDPRMVFAQTIAGTEAIRTPTQRLSMPARRLLMLLDGRRSLSQLPSVVRPDDVPTLLRELEAHGMITLTGMSEAIDGVGRMHPDLKMAQVKRSLAGVFEKELGQQASVLEARVQDCVNLPVLRNVLREVITLVGQRKDADAADRIAAIVKKHGPF